MSTINYRIVSERETALRVLQRYWRTPGFALSETARLWRRARKGLPAVDLEWASMGLQDCYALRRTHEGAPTLWTHDGDELFAGEWLSVHRRDLDDILEAAHDRGFSLGWLPSTIVTPAMIGGAR